MKRYVQYALVFALSLALWATALLRMDALAVSLVPLLQRVSSAGISEAQVRSGLGIAVPAAPLYLLVVLGCYCLARLGCDLLAFRDDPKEIAKLEQVRRCNHTTYVLGVFCIVYIIYSSTCIISICIIYWYVVFESF
jgi:hypothetical protein